MDRIRQIWVSSQANNHNEPLRTSHTFDDDEVFLAAARHLLSSHHIPNNMTRQQRTSFLEGLRVRQKQLDVMAPAVAAAVQALQAQPEIEQTLVMMTLGEGGDTTTHATYSVQSIHHQRNQQHHHKPEAPNKTKRSRRFFPSSSFDGDSIGSGSRISSAFRNNRRRVQNIDLSEAVEQMHLTNGNFGHPEQQQQRHHHHPSTTAAALGSF